MNQQTKPTRIHQLAEQAGLLGPSSRVGNSHQAAERFAELIVRECQDRVEHYSRDCGEIGSLPDTVIKKHFGVE